MSTDRRSVSLCLLILGGLAPLACGSGDPAPGAAGGDSGVGGSGAVEVGGGGAAAVGAGGSGSAGAGSGGASGGGGAPSALPRCGDDIRHHDLGERCDDGPAGSEECTPDCRAAYEDLFDPRALPSFYIDVPAASVTVLGECARDESGSQIPAVECDYQEATFHAVIDPDPADGVEEALEIASRPIGIRRKGRASWAELDEKPSWKVKFTEFGGTEFMGLSRLTLNNLKQDPSGLRERIGYGLFRSAGVPAPLANSARVFVRLGSEATYREGLYANVQTVDKQFLRWNFGEVGGEVGNLYDTYNDRYFVDLDRSIARDQSGPLPGRQELRFELETNDTVADKSDLTALIDAIDVPNVGDERETFWSVVGGVADHDEFLAAFAMMAVLADWDGFAAARNNYKVYHELRRDRFLLVPWGIDQTFGQRVDSGSMYFPNWAYPIDHSDSRRERSLYFLRCLDDTAGCGARYRSAVEAAGAVLDGAGVEAKVTAYRAQIAPYVDWDSATFTRFADYLAQFARERPACVRAQLAGGSCRTLACPAAHSSCSD